MISPKPEGTDGVASPEIARSAERVQIAGKFFRLGPDKWIVRGVSYGPFPPNGAGEFLPDPDRVRSDLAHLTALGGNAIRVYHPPPVWLLDLALEHGVRVFVDLPWEKHRCFLDDWEAQVRARETVRSAARAIGGHTAVLGISVANEIPCDVVRFQGRRNVERFLDGLIEIVKEEAPGCPATYVNFPTTEFLQPERSDFACFNVYLHDADNLARYLDRLHHVAGDLPLLLTEHGFDSLRIGEEGQASLLEGALGATNRRGLAGSFVFSFTDEWYTGGALVEDWAFGITRTDRTEKPAAGAVRHAWTEAAVPSEGLPKASVVICTYNGGTTLEECLESLRRLRYPNYEVIVVDDGSTDGTPEIVARFPEFVSVRQPNFGLSVARNVGAEKATGEIVAYTDSDCVADEDWLRYLVEGMLDQDVDVIGGPNITPESDGWVARCVSASPGNPRHVMLDDRRAEHVPGCNMAFRRTALLSVDGFDPQFRAAGDDVDACWRLLDRGSLIGFAPGAMVWHHRRATIRAFLGQQRGYGRAEAMLFKKHPHRFGGLVRFSWKGVLYGTVPGLPALPPTIYHGPRGAALFQTIYHDNRLGWWACSLSLEWHLIATLCLLLAFVAPPFALVSLGMWAITLSVAVTIAVRTPFPAPRPRWWCRPLIGLLHVLQPAARAWHRYAQLRAAVRLPATADDPEGLSLARGRSGRRDLFWESRSGTGRESLLDHLEGVVAEEGWTAYRDDGCSPWDTKLLGDGWHGLQVRTATEELGGERRFTRARASAHLTLLARLAVILALTGAAIGVAIGEPWSIAAGGIGVISLAASLMGSRRRCMRGLVSLLARAGRGAGLTPVDARAPASPAVITPTRAGSFVLPQTPGEGATATNTSTNRAVSAAVQANEPIVSAHDGGPER